MTRIPGASFSSGMSLWAFVYGFLFAGGVLRVTPGAPYVGLLLSGLVVGLLVPDARRSGVVATTLGVAVVTLARIYHPDLFVPAWSLTAVLLAPAGALCASLVIAPRVALKYLSYALVVVLCALFLVQGFRAVPGLDRRIGGEPRAETYNYDPYFFIKTFYLMEDHGEGYYQAYGQAVRDDARFSQPVSNLAGWRTPALTYLWMLLFGSSHGITVGFVVIAAAMLAVGYAIAVRVSDPATALVVPALLSAYFLAAMDSLHYLSYEVWASFFCLTAAALVTYGRNKTGLVFAVAAAAIREWFVSALIAGILDHLRKRRWRSAAVWAAGLLVVLAFFVFNVWNAREYLLSLGLRPTSGAAGRLGRGGPLFVLYTLQFNARFFVQEYAVPYLVFFLGLIGCAALVRRGELFLPSLVLMPVIFFLFAGSGHRPGDPYGMDVYYSGAFLPFSMIAACCARQLLRPQESRGIEPNIGEEPGPIGLRSSEQDYSIPV